MAQSLDAVPVAKLESFLVCSICLETLKDPRTLPCFHSYCRSCLEKFVKKQRDRAQFGQQIREFNCPTCRNPFTLNPEDKVEDMGQSHFIYNMLEVMAVDQHRVKGVPCTYCQRPSVGRCVACEAFLCQECLKSHNSFLGFKDHVVLSMDELSKPENQTKVRGKLHCREHKKKTLKFYCETCQELICRRCMDFNHNKAGHSCLAVEDVAEKEKKILVSNSAALEGKLLEGKNALKKVINAKQSLEKVKEQTKRDINQRKENLLKELTRQLNDQAQHLLKEVEEIYVGKHNTLVQQEAQVKGYVEKLESCTSLSKGLLEKGTDEEILSSAKMMKSNIEKLQNETLKKVEPVEGDVISYKCNPIDFSKFSVISEAMGKVTAALETKALTLRDLIVSWIDDKSAGNQPDGQMSVRTVSWGLPGYDHSGSIIIEYSFKSGTQDESHPNPGQRYSGTQRTAYLPNTKEGKKVLTLLKKAFDQRLTFTIGTSATTNASNQVIWNGIPHKTNVRGGPTNYGYPDYDYLRRVQEELKLKGIE